MKTDQTPAIANLIAADIDEIVKSFASQAGTGTAAGERRLNRHFVKTLYKYALHKEDVLFDKATSTFVQYY